MSLTGRNILITGGSRGIGREIATGLALKGATCTVVSRNRESINDCLIELRQFTGREHFGFAMDVANHEDWVRFTDWRTGIPDVTDLICSAAILGPIGPIGTYPVEEFSRTFDVNVFGVYRSIVSNLDTLKRHRGSVMLISGGGAATPNPNFTAYGSSKAAIVRIAENLGAELEPDSVIVNAVAPRFISTRMHQQTLASEPELVGQEFFEKTQAVVDGRSGDSPEHVISLAIFLMDSGKERFTGKFVSAVWDDWRNDDFRERLRNEPNFATNRRIDDFFFSSKNSE
jgi:NAD(P)-dependent dehydrogenase (short-subunit alcohol dehydrogenase family)